jgi:RNA polymerase sigma factor (sigma-70 family)
MKPKNEQGNAKVTLLADNEIMQEVKDGKVEKLAILFERYHLMLYNFFLRLTGNRNVSEDLVQDVFFRILKYRASYQPLSKFTIWMYQIARNTHIDHLRKQKDETPLEEAWDQAVSREPLPEEELETSQEIALVRQALDKLSLKKKEILLLSRFQNLKYKEIAELLGCQEGTVKATVHRALKELGKLYFELSGGIAS